MRNVHTSPLTLQRRQEEFDLAHGLNNIGASGNLDRTGIDLGMAQFAVLGLCGECGEVANALKKILRAAAFHRDTGVPMRQLRSELADVFAYLLKAASVLKVDLEEEFLHTVALNCLRFPLVQKSSAIRLVGIGGDRAVADARELADAVERNSRKPALVVNLPHPPATDVAGVMMWLREAIDSVTDALSAGVPGDYVFVANDPAYSAMTFLLATQDLPREERISIANEWLAFEQATWQHVSLRRLFISSISTPEPVELALHQHGARTLSPADDCWLQLQSMVTS